MASKRTAVPALTTTFTPASSCTINYYKYPYVSDGYRCVDGTTIVQCIYFHLGRSTSEADCFPDDWSSATDAYYSPGICPAGYTEACSYVLNSQTLATCCPSGYYCQTRNDFTYYSANICQTAMSSAEEFVYTTLLQGQGDVSFTVTQKEGINAFGVRISYASSDFVTTSSAVPSSSSPASSPASSTFSQAAATATPEPSTSHDSGLSRTATAGISVGVSVAAMLLIGLFLFLILRYRKKGLAVRTQGDLNNIAMGTQNPAPGPGGYAVVPTGSPEPNNLENKHYDTPSPVPPTVPPSNAPPPPFHYYAEVSGEGIVMHASELHGDNGIRH